MSIARIKGSRTGIDVRLWAPPQEVESQALTQLRNLTALPWVFHHVAAMPDVHVGIGATVGSVVAMKGAICPAAVGVDIGCGMAAIRTSLRAGDLPESLASLRSALEERIPVGFSEHREPLAAARKLALWEEFAGLDARVQDRRQKALRQVGTLGGGNHFVELCLDTADGVWLMLHSGSRNVGKELAEVHIGRARKLAHNAALPDRDLAVFLAGTTEMVAYRRDLFWAQRYALANRQAMIDLCKGVLQSFFAGVSFEETICCHHNYCADEVHFGEEVLVTRKGAIRAGKGDLGIIPGSMGTRSYIVRGLGNPESFESASHGAGRRMSRTAARKVFTVLDLEAQTAGVECRKDRGVLDEIPGAYKPIEKVMEQQRDLVEIVAELRQVLCIKG